MLLLDERIRGDGTHARSWAERAGDRVRISDDDATSGELSIAALDRVMCRYGRPLDPDVHLEGEALELSGGHRLRRLRYHAPVDATGRDYLVWERPGGEPLAVVATMAAAALRYLVLRLSAERPQESEG
ncbi:MAG TPA: hypothetical protein VN253_28700 [Kofleriaceae bacterium]|nr:hypothetical protein [Kofleriaceae bacterium]